MRIVSISLTTIFFLLSILGSSFCQAQEYLFKVLASAGNSQVKTQTLSQWEPLKIGTALQKGDVLQLEEGAYIGLVHVSGNTIELKQSGTFPVDELSTPASAQPMSIAGKYLDFIITKMTESPGTHQLSATGAVTRGKKGPIQLFLPPLSSFISARQLISWTQMKEPVTFVLEVKNIFNEVLYQVETTENRHLLDFDDPQLATFRVVNLVVYVKGKEHQKSEPCALKRLSGNDATAYQAKLDHLRLAINPGTSIGQVTLAGFFEMNDLLVDAKTAYHMAYDLSPEVGDYKNIYQKFLARNNLTPP